MGTIAVPRHADVVVVGGGVMGLSTAFHLAAAGVERVVLVERDALGEGSTCKAAGGVRALFSDEINIRLGQRGLETFERFGAEFDTEIDLHQVGYLLLAQDAATMEAFERNAELMTALGLQARTVDVAEAARLSPLISTEGLVGGLFSPRDGHCTPESVVQGYARAARRAGATLHTGTRATGIEVEDGAVTAVHTSRGTIATDTVVCAAGAWSREIAEWVGEDLPIEPLRRQIVVTEPVPQARPDTPFTIDFATGFYFHAEGPGLLMGAPESTDSRSFDLNRDPAWLDDLADCMQRRVPSLADVGIRTGWAGLYEMTPDHNAVIGRSETVDGFLYAAGFSGHGFLMGPAVGEVMRDLHLGKRPFVDVSPLHASRFAADAGRPELNII
ncbi:NAD(P)/FAD-dependent oxidoreductase [Aeromicrobium duanguangcaii]|uniref:NAD(P)/FAD-dependent oxidoreductase n=1 Tax=Aeromicrobium duanguangcaii TaxID=2968086 RepID=UPI0020181FF6|nr:FAD-binding oxidoreductase [Aeromicrobium duanguangcaii]MCL3838161.1 FAD-binding oxidoreductase [Aeromicrobium duanguangcaii]